eukprot:767934-Hanusia_phi.AAC.2
MVTRRPQVRGDDVACRRNEGVDRLRSGRLVWDRRDRLQGAVDDDHLTWPEQGCAHGCVCPVVMETQEARDRLVDQYKTQLSTSGHSNVCPWKDNAVGEGEEDGGQEERQGERKQDRVELGGLLCQRKQEMTFLILVKLGSRNADPAAGEQLVRCEGSGGGKVGVGGHCHLRCCTAATGDYLPCMYAPAQPPCAGRDPPLLPLLCLAVLFCPLSSLVLSGVSFCPRSTRTS